MLLHSAGDAEWQREITTLSVDPSTDERTPTCRSALFRVRRVSAPYLVIGSAAESLGRRGPR